MNALVGPGLEVPVAGDALPALLREAERLRVLGDPDAPDLLATIARQAMRADDRGVELQARLRLVMALAERGRDDDGRALIGRAAREADGQPEHALARALALAALDEPILYELEEALTRADRGPESAHDRMAGWARVAEARGHEGSWRKADQAWARAIAIAVEYRDQSAVERLAVCRAGGLIRNGATVEAGSTLGPALESEDPALRLAAMLIQLSVLLATDEPVQARTLGRQARQLARQRRAWHAFASAAISEALALEGLGAPRAAQLNWLRAALKECRDQGEPGALIVARLMELEG